MSTEKIEALQERLIAAEAQCALASAAERLALLVARNGEFAGRAKALLSALDGVDERAQLLYEDLKNKAGSM